MEKEELRNEVVEAVDEALSEGLSKHAAEDVLQSEAQNIREDRRVYQVFVYECPKENCDETSTQLIDQAELHCDICDGMVSLLESTRYDDIERMEFRCEHGNHSTARIHDFSNEENTCSIHNVRMGLLNMYETEEGLGE